MTVSSYNLQFIPIADDVISLENDTAFKEIWVVSTCDQSLRPRTMLRSCQDGDETVVYDSTQALLTLEKLHGLFPRIVGKGDYAAVCMWPQVTSLVLRFDHSVSHIYLLGTPLKRPQVRLRTII